MLGAINIVAFVPTRDSKECWDFASSKMTGLL